MPADVTIGQLALTVSDLEVSEAEAFAQEVAVRVADRLSVAGVDADILAVDLAVRVPSGVSRADLPRFVADQIVARLR